MRKTIYLLMLILTFHSCKEAEAPPKLDVWEVYETYEKIFDSSLTEFHPDQFMSSQSVSEDKKLITLYKKVLSLSIQNQLKEKYFKDVNYQIDYFNFQRIGVSTNSRIGPPIDFDNVSTLSNNQKVLVEPFINEMLAIPRLNLVQPKVYSFVEEVMSSNLTDEEKGELTVLAAATSSLKTFMQEDGVAVMYNFMETLIDDNTSGRISTNCDVNWRSVWGSAVTGFFGFGAAGLYTGCTGGTVVLPGIGTATGCVGGAVFGAAGGFTSGALYGIATELLLTCFRSTGGGTSCMGNNPPQEGETECHLVEQT